MKKRLNIKIEEVKIDQELQVVGMFGGPCGGGGNGGGIQGGTQAAQNAANQASAMGIGNVGQIANEGVADCSSFGSSNQGGALGPIIAKNIQGRMQKAPIGHVVDALKDPTIQSITCPSSTGINAVVDGVFGAPVSGLWR